MTNKIRFFEEEDKMVCKYENVPIPQLQTTVFLFDVSYRVVEITYDFAEGENDYNLIDITVEKI